jgi:hypothetical protein
VTEQAVPTARRPLWRQLLPFVVAIALVTFVLARVDWASFAGALAGVNYPAFMLFMGIFVVALLSADVLAGCYIYRQTVAKEISYWHMFCVRGASYLPSLLNHHVGQAWLTYLLAKVYKAPLKRTAGATLLVYVTWGGCLLALGCVGLLTSQLAAVWVLIPLGAGVSYLILLAVKPAALANNSVLGPLFEVGVRGHIAAMVARVPHVMVLFVGTWAPFFFFDVNIPLPVALVYMPVVMLVVSLPVAPLGLGTRDALVAEFFQDYVAGAHTVDERLGVLAAATVAVAVAIAIFGALVGLVMMRFALRLLPRESSELESPVSA